jgi:hypothetical protein
MSLDTKYMLGAKGLETHHTSAALAVILAKQQIKH